MIRKTALLLLLTLAASCGVDYDGEKRLVFETQVTDTDNHPIAGKHLRIEVVDGGNEDVISSGITDVNGNLRLIFPAPAGFSATLNVHYDGDLVLQEKHITNIIAADFHDYKLALTPLKLYRNDQITTLDLVPNPSSDLKEISQIRVHGERPDDYFDYRTQSAYEQDTYLYNSRIIKNQDVTLSYRITDHNTDLPTITDFEETIHIGNGPVTYSINY